MHTSRQNTRNRAEESSKGADGMSTRLLLNERPLTVLPSLVKLMGMERAVIIQQIHWLLQGKGNGEIVDGYKWIWGTHDKWCDDYFPFWQPATLRKHMAHLEKDGYLLSVQLRGWDRTKHYRIDYDALEDGLHQQMTDEAHDQEDTIEHDDTQCIEHDHTQCIEHDHAASMRDDHAASKRDDHAASKRDDHAASIYRTKTSAKTSTKTSAKKGEDAPKGAPPGPPFEEFLQELCFICHGHKETATLTVKDIGALRAEAKKIRGGGFTVADLRDWMQNIWFKDWRWEKGQQRPTPAIVRSTIAGVRAEPEDERPRNAYSRYNTNLELRS